MAGRHDTVLGVSLGKQKETALEDAAADYIAVMRAVYAGILVVGAGFLWSAFAGAAAQPRIADR